jgi:hypothetical protein
MNVYVALPPQLFSTNSSPGMMLLAHITLVIVPVFENKR